MAGICNTNFIGVGAGREAEEVATSWAIWVTYEFDSWDQTYSIDQWALDRLISRRRMDV